MNPIPLDAMPIVEILRRDVPRPKELPRMCFGVARWRKGMYGEDEDFCPMGLHERSTDHAPYIGENFAGGVCTTDQVEAFFKWWDEITEPENIPEAMDAVWSPKGE